VPRAPLFYARHSAGVARSRVMTTPELEVRAIAAERLTFFSDAVIAIALTLLALDLTVPGGATNGDLLRSVLDHRDDYIAFMISFVVIGAHWRGHHRVFRFVTMLTPRLTTLTMAWLFMQVVTPFATRVITGNGGFQVRFGFYALVEGAAFLLFVFMVLEIKRAALYRDDVPAGLFTRAINRTGTMAFAFLVSIPVSFATHWAYAVWIAAPVLWASADRVRRNLPHPSE
jgi:uncharacterized membrane protein